MRPTRIVQKPWTKQVGGSKYSQVRCDNDIIYTIQELAELFGVSQQYMSVKIRSVGWQSKKVFQFKKYKTLKPLRIVRKPTTVTTKKGKQKRIECDNGVTYTTQELAIEMGVTPSCLSTWLKNTGWKELKLDRKRQRPRGEYHQDSPYKTVVDGDLSHLSDKVTRFGVKVIR